MFSIIGDIFFLLSQIIMFVSTQYQIIVKNNTSVGAFVLEGISIISIILFAIILTCDIIKYKTQKNNKE